MQICLGLGVLLRFVWSNLGGFALSTECCDDDNVQRRGFLKCRACFPKAQHGRSLMNDSELINIVVAKEF